MLQQQVKPCLEKLRNDTDGDVQYYALEAQESKCYWGWSNYSDRQIPKSPRPASYTH